MTPFELAKKLANEISKTQKYRIAAVISDKRGRVLATGVNSYRRTHPKQAAFARMAGEPHRVFLHAEVHALCSIRANDRSRAERISIVRVDSKGESVLGRPCKICEWAIRGSGIKIVEYSL